MGMKDIRIRTACGGDAQALLEIYAPYVEHTAITCEYETPERSDMVWMEKRIGEHRTPPEPVIAFPDL